MKYLRNEGCGSITNTTVRKTPVRASWPLPDPLPVPTPPDPLPEPPPTDPFPPVPDPLPEPLPPPAPAPRPPVPQMKYLREMGHDEQMRMAREQLHRRLCISSTSRWECGSSPEI